MSTTDLVGLHPAWLVHAHDPFHAHIYFDASDCAAAVLERIKASGLRALVHQLTDDDLADRTSEAMWISEPLPPDLAVMDPPGTNQGFASCGNSDF